MLKNRFFYALILFILVSCSALADANWQPFRVPLGPWRQRFELVKVDLHSIVCTHKNEIITSEEFFSKLEKADVVLIGESHTSFEHHEVQRRIIEGLHNRGNKLVLGLEMFNRSHNTALDNFVTGQSDIKAFPFSTDYFNSWGHNFRHYQKIFAFAQQAGIPMRGINLPISRIRAIRRAGMKNYRDELLPDEPLPDTRSREHRFFIQTMMQGIGALVPETFDDIYLAQCMWDAAMADGIVLAADEFPGRRIVALAGHGHVSYGLGINRMIELSSALSVVSVIPVDISQAREKKDDEHPGFAIHMGKDRQKNSLPHSVVSSGLANFLIGVVKEDRDKFPPPLFRVSQRDNKLVAGMIMPGTIAYKAGFRSNDQIISFAGKKWDCPDKLNNYIHLLDWGRKVNARVLRAGRSRSINAVIKPVKK